VEASRRFAFRLCLALGVPHPDYLGELLSVRQLGEWRAFFEREPWGFEVEDTRHAMSAFIAARAAGSKTAKLDSFRLVPPEPSEVDDEEDNDDRLARQVRAAFGLPAR
jgi:hypothetical protein